MDLSNMEKAFEQRPTIGLAGLALTTVKEAKIPRAQWPAMAVLGFFYLQYKREYNIVYPFSAVNDVRRDFVEVDSLIDSMGAADVCRCIEVLFGPDMAWAKTKTLNMLTKLENRNKFLIPLMAKSKGKVRGEFSEYGGSRSTQFVVKKL